MGTMSRRDFVRNGLFGLAVAGTGGALALRAGAEPTEPSGNGDSYSRYLEEEKTPSVKQEAGGEGLKVTENNILGPFYRQGAPYRAKITPPLEPGTTLLIRGRVWGFDSRKPLAGAVLDIWQANAKGRYDNDDSDHPPAGDVFLNRARLVTDENGGYEYETIHPGRYKIGPDTWRPSHIHYMVSAAGYKKLVTQLYFAGDPRNNTDEFIKQSLIIEVKEVAGAGGKYESGVFDVVLAPGK